MQILSNLSLYGTLGLNSVADANTDTDKFLVIDSSGIVKYRTGAELYNDIGAGGAAAYTSVLQHTVKAGVALTKGQAVYVTSADGTNMIVGKASNASEATSSKTLGLIVQDLAINDQGFVITEGLLAGLDTSTAAAGDPVWLGTDGNLIYGLLNKPYAPNHLVFIGIVTRAQQNNGEIFVKVQNGFELQELHNVQITSTPSDNAVLAYETSTSLYKMKSIPTLLGYTPVTNARSITINGTTYDLSADRSWSVGTHTGNLTTGYVPKATGATTLTDSLIYDNGSGIGINTSSPYESSAFKLDVNGGLLIKNTSGTTAQLILINSNPATGGNNGFVQLSAGGNTETAFGQWQTYYGMSVAAGALRLQPAGGQVLIGTTTTSAFLTDINGTLRVSGQLTLGSTISNNTYVYTMPGASGTLALVSQIPSLSGYLTIASADATYLTQSSAASIYLSQTSASNTYLTISGAASTYLSQASASNTYLTISGASSIYLSQTSASNTYLTINGASITYLSQTSASNTYLTINNAASTYVSLTGSYANPSWITSLAWSKITGAPAFITGIDSSMVTTALGYTPVTNARTITINGTAYDLSADRSWTVTATETDTLATVTARGASTTTRTTFTEVGVTRAGSDDVSAGPWFRWTNVAEDRQMLVQLNGSNGLTWWSYNGTSWASRMTLQQGGQLVLNNGLSNGSSEALVIGGSGDVRLSDGASIFFGAYDYSASTYIRGYDDGNLMRFYINGTNSVTFTSSGISASAISVGSNAVWHAGNFSPSNYLPLSGGTMTGDITISGDSRGIYFTGGNNRIYFGGYRALEGSNTGTVLQVGEGYSITQIQSATTQIDGNLYINNNGGRIYFDRLSGDTVGAIGFHSNDVFYVAGHPSYGPNAGNNVKVYGFGADLSFGSSNAGDVITINNSGTVNVNYPIIISGIDSALKVQHNGTSTAWRGRIGSFNASADKSSFLGNYTGRPGVFGHNNSLSAWAELYVNTLGIYGQGDVYLSWFSYVKGNGNDTNYPILHSANYNSYSPTLTGGGASGTWGISISGVASQVSINYNNDSNANYQLLWGSGNSVYGTGSVYVNPSTDTVYANYFSSAYYMDVYTSAGSDYLRITDNQVYRPNGGILYLNWSSNANVALTGPSGGNVGVGNNSPSYKMHVSGDIYANGGWLRVSGDAGLYFESYGGGWRMTGSSYIESYGSKSLHMNGASVDYVGSLYFSGAGHIQPNAGSYGSLQMTNAKNGWAGIRFTESEVNLMMNSNESGHYRNGYGWQFRWYNGAFYISTGSQGGGTEYTAIHSGNIGSQSVSYASSTNLLNTLSNYVWSASTLPSGYNAGIQTSFVSSSEGFPSYGSVLTNRTYTGSQGGTLQLYTPYGPAYGGTRLGFRSGIYETSEWSGWKYLLNDVTDPYAANMNQYVRSTDDVNFNTVGIPGASNTPINITGSAHKYLTINPGNGYEAMVRYIGGTGSSWYVGKRTSGQLVGTQSFHFYSEEAAATVGGINPSGDMMATGSMRAPIFYDSADTGYYLDPNGTSVLSSSYIGGHYYGNNNSSNILIKTSAASGDAGIVVQNSSGSFKFQVYGNGSDYGFLNGTWAGWDIRKTATGNLYLNGQSTYYYGSDTTYMYRVYGTADMRSPIYYDLDNTAYYGDFASTSNLNQLTANYISVGQSINTSYRIIINGDYYANGGGNYWAEGRFKQYRGSGTWHDVIDSGNIGSQSVSYASSSGNADTVDSLHASSFVRRDTTGQFLKPYQEYGSYISNSTLPNELVSNMGGGGLRVDFLNGASFGTWSHVITFSGYNGYNMYQLAGHYKGSGGAGPDLYVRNEPNHAQTSWSSWARLLNTSSDPYPSNMDQYVRTSDSVSFSTVSGSDVYTTGGWFRNHTNNNGIYWSNTGWHLYPYDANDFYMRSGSGESSIRFLRSDGTVLGYLHNATDFTMGFLTSSRSWRLRVENGGRLGTYGPIARSGHATGFLEGSYNNVGGNSYYTNPIYTIGSSYNPSDSSLNSMYGIGYSHPNFWGSGKVGGWGMYVCSAGTIDAIIGGDGSSTTIWAKTDIVAYSDARVKENVQVIENALEKVQAIRGVTFTRNDVKDKEKRSAGVIAQEVLAVMPEVVTGTEEDMYSVAYGNMAALFIEAIKEQQKQIEDLKSKLDAVTK